MERSRSRMYFSSGSWGVPGRACRRPVPVLTLAVLLESIFTENSAVKAGICSGAMSGSARGPR